MLDDPGILVLPLDAGEPAETTGVMRDYLRHMDARQHRGALRTWEGEGGKLASARRYGVRSAEPAFSTFVLS